jgi:hypothetical protein
VTVEDPVAAAWHPFAGSEIALSAETPVVSTVHHPFGSPSGPGLFRMKGAQLPAYVQNIAHALLRTGRAKDESSAIQMAIGVVKRWARGGGKVHPEVRAAAAEAIAEWESLKAAAHSHANDGPSVDLAGMYTEALHPRAAGGKFGNKGGQPAAAARARNTPKSAAIPAAPGLAGPMTRAQQLRYQASQDRHLAHQIMLRVAALTRQRDALIAGIPQPRKAVSGVKSAAAKKAAATRKAGGKSKQARVAARIAAAMKSGKPQQSRVAKLNGQIKLLKNDARMLSKAANRLDAQAAHQ